MLCVLAAKNPPAIKAASAGNGIPTLSSAMNTAISQTP
jgi:hypothetical protein